MLQRHPALGEAVWLLAAIALSLAFFAPTLSVFFSLDDLLFLERAAGFEDWNKGLRRLVSVQFFFTAGWRLFGDRPLFYHLVILILHGLNAWLVTRLAMALGLKRGAERLAGLLFLISPAAFTSLHWISGIQEVCVAFFALLSALFLLRGTTRWDVASLVAYALALLSKESAILALPLLLLLTSMGRRRRVVMLAISLLMGLALLYGAGAFDRRVATDPYATIYGSNILWNLLTYLAWLVRPWEHFPDQVPQYSMELRRWGLILPALLALLAWRRRDWAPAIGRASLLFVGLLLPVLPLIRHSYFYYLYLPLVPLWLLAAAGLEKLLGRSVKLRVLAYVLPLALLLVSAWQGRAHRGDLIEEKLVRDPFLRYAQLAETAVGDLRELSDPPQGRILVVTPFMGESVDLAKGLRKEKGMQRRQFLPLETALYGGHTLKLFFPEVTDAEVVMGLEGSEGWEGQSIYWTYGQGRVNYLGEGEAARRNLVKLYMKYRKLPEAAAQLDRILQDHPEDPALLHDSVLIAVALRDSASAQAKLDRLRALAERSDSPPRAQELLDLLLTRIDVTGGD